MLTLTKAVHTFPSVSLPSSSGGLPVEVSLIAQMGHGSGDQMIAGVAARQRGHAEYIDALDEPSTRIGGIDLAHGDRSSLYTFVVGANGHPFHRHAGHRVFTAVSGSAGTQLRFSTATPAEIERDPHTFIRSLQQVNIPPDCLFCVRFGGDTWHQFLPLQPGLHHPALFALSCHTDELGGALEPTLRQRVLDNAADIPALTELLPPLVLALLASPGFRAERIPTVALSVDAAAVTWAGTLCAVTRSVLGRIRGAWARWLSPAGFVAENGGGRECVESVAPPADSLLNAHLPNCDHQDSFAVTLEAGELRTESARTALVAVLQGFLDRQPIGVTRLMRLRNALVRPFRLRTSPLGCPVSSLLAQQSPDWFVGRYPVHAQSLSAGDDHAQVLLGADDKHLKFRSCVSVRLQGDGRAVITLSNRVRTTNLFGRFYLAAIDHVHRHYVSPAMLRLAVDQAVRVLRAERCEVVGKPLRVPVKA
jgi:hypothetical protein